MGQRHPVTQQGLPLDPLGYDTSDFRACVQEMAEAALSGRNSEAVREEIARAEQRLGLSGRPMSSPSAPGDKRRLRLLIPDNGPLALLALVGEHALDWLFVPGAEVWITDMVRQEALRDADPDDVQRREHRAVIRAWFDRNGHRIRIQETDAGEEYRKAMEAWELAGRLPQLKPSWRGRGDASILQVLDAAAKVVASGEAIVALVDDRKVRAALRVTNKTDIDLMATETFLAWMAGRFGIEEARAAWLGIE